MARDTDLINRRNADILREFARLRGLRVGRARKYTAEYVITKLSETFYLSESRIEAIVYRPKA